MPCEKLYTKSKDLTKILKCAKVKIMTKPTRLRPSQGGEFHAPVGPAPEVVAEVRAEDPANRIFRGKNATIEIGGKLLTQDEVFQRLIKETLDQNSYFLTPGIEKRRSSSYLTPMQRALASDLPVILIDSRPVPALVQDYEIVCRDCVTKAEDLPIIRSDDLVWLANGQSRGRILARVVSLDNEGTSIYFKVVRREAEPTKEDEGYIIPRVRVAARSNAPFDVHDSLVYAGSEASVWMTPTQNWPGLILVEFSDGIVMLQRFRGWTQYNDGRVFIDFSDRM